MVGAAAGGLVLDVRSVWKQKIGTQSVVVEKGMEETEVLEKVENSHVFAWFEGSPLLQLLRFSFHSNATMYSMIM